MKYLRIILRLLAILVWTLLLLVVLASGYLVVIWKRPARIAWRAWMVHLWAAGTVRIAGARVSVSGQSPRPPFLLVANHTSYFDILLLASRVTAVYVSRADVSSWPIVGFLARIAGTLFIDRRNKKDVLRINELIATIHSAGGGVVFFPEGTTSMGIAVQRFKAPLLDLPAKQRIPVSYAALRYKTNQGDPAANEAICWWGDMAFVPHLAGLLGLSGFHALITFGDDPVSSSDRKQLAHLLESRVRSLFTPMVSGPDQTPATTADPE